MVSAAGTSVWTRPAPDRRLAGWFRPSLTQSGYGDSFRAFVATSKCADAIPLYRQAKQMSRLGIPISRSTLTDLLHQAALSQ